MAGFKAKWLAGFALLGLATPTVANADIVCALTVSNLWITPDGWINVALSGTGFDKGWWLCPVSGSTSINDGYGAKTITSDSCKAIWSQLLTLKAAGKPINLMFHGPVDCTAASLPADGTQPNPFPSNFGFNN